MAVGETDSTIFMMPLKEIQKIQDSFEDVYQELLDIASKRHTNHRILMSNEIRDYIQQVKLDTDQSSSEISDSEDIFSDRGSQNGEEKFNDPRNDKLVAHGSFDMQAQPDQYNAENQGDTEKLNARMSLAATQKKFIDRKSKFDEEYKKTLLNFNINMDFLKTQQKSI